MRDEVVEALAQTIAPRLYQLCGRKPEEMGFPFGDTKEEVEALLEQQFDPVGYWLKKARELAEISVSLIEAGGLTLSEVSIDAMLKAAGQYRADVKADGTQAPLADLL